MLPRAPRWHRRTSQALTPAPALRRTGRGHVPCPRSAGSLRPGVQGGVVASRLRDRSRAFLSTGSTLAAFRIPGYWALWVSSAAGAIGWSVSFVAVGWIALVVSNSPFVVGLAFAARVGPALVLGIPLGAVVDRFDRRVTLVSVHFVIFALMLGIAGLAVAGRLGLVEILGTSVVLGGLDTIRGTANQSYA